LRRGSAATYRGGQFSGEGIVAGQGANIRAIGGAESEGHGAVAMLIEDFDEDELADLLSQNDFPSTVLFAAEAVLDDRSGALAEACGLLADLDIQSILVADTHLGRALVSFGFSTQQDADEARDLLGALAVPEHTLTAAWAAHEAWDRANADSPPDPFNP
jgi:hypothetical protein